MRMASRIALCVAALGMLGSMASADKASDPYIGRWALTIPGGGAGWLGVEDKGDYLDASILWGGGSVLPVSSVYMDGKKLVVTRIHEVERKDKTGKVVRKQQFVETIEAKLKGNDKLSLVQIEPRHNGEGVERHEFTGERIPPVPPAPDLSKVTFGDPIVLFNGKNLDGWRLTNPKATNGWHVEDGVLVNTTEENKGYRYGNLRTDQEFNDFNLHIEVKVPKDGNSGVYLRGIYEVQVLDSYGHPLDSHNMGAIYSRITPTVSAEKPAGEWETLDITLVDRHVTVDLNGTRIIDNQPLLGCTGGALWSDEFRPGPIYLQGDHGTISYRNIVLRPVVQ